MSTVRHQTPDALALALSRHVPHRLRRLLDPAVGDGVLLEPILRRKRLLPCEVWAIDIDHIPLKSIADKTSGNRDDVVNIICDDFLGWVEALPSVELASFDCVVMNPPFSARKETWRSLRRIRERLCLPELPTTAPIEAAFIVAALMLLRPGGRLLAILPAAMMTTFTMGWLRDTLRSAGKVHQVHELPPGTFQHFEGRVYLVVFERRTRSGDILLLNHDLKRPEKLILKRDAQAPGVRFDYGYHNSMRELARLWKQNTFGWTSIGQLAQIWRGTESSPNISKTVCHTSNYSDGQWVLERLRGDDADDVGHLRTRLGDILVKRVGRNCSRSFGPARLGQALCSDCVLVLRPKNSKNRDQLLFAIRVLLSESWGPSLLERATGAAYISQTELSALKVPYDLAELMPTLFSRYRRAIQKGRGTEMIVIEQSAHRRMLELMEG